MLKRRSGGRMIILRSRGVVWFDVMELGKLKVSGVYERGERCKCGRVTVCWETNLGWRCLKCLRLEGFEK